MAIGVTWLRTWPVPALLAWGGGWAVWVVAARVGVHAGLALLAGLLPALLMLRYATAGWRRAVVLGGLPLSLLLVTGVDAVPAWAWLVAGAVLLLIYPVRAWRDAPWFPTPHDALRDLPAQAPLVAGARVLDAGSGLGDGLIALARAYPHAVRVGVEGGWLLAWASRLRLGRAGQTGARVVHGDFWRAEWSGFALVYLFQRPETMARAWAKASREMRAGAWLVSLEFPVEDLQAAGRAACPDGRPIWIYRVSGTENSTGGPIRR